MLTDYDKYEQAKAEIKRKLQRAIRYRKQKLQAKARQDGMWECFGQDERHELERLLEGWECEASINLPYFGECDKLISAFDKWAMNYVPPRG